MPKKGRGGLGAWTVCRFKGGAWQERGGGVFEWALMHTIRKSVHKKNNFISTTQATLTLSWWKSLSMDSFLYDSDLCYEKVKRASYLWLESPLKLICLQRKPSTLIPESNLKLNFDKKNHYFLATIRSKMLTKKCSFFVDLLKCVDFRVSSFCENGLVSKSHSVAIPL